MTDDISLSGDYASDRRAKAHRAWKSAETIKRLSDRLIFLTIPYVQNRLGRQVPHNLILSEVSAA